MDPALRPRLTAWLREQHLTAHLHFPGVTLSEVAAKKFARPVPTASL